MTTLLGPELGSASLVLVYLGLILATPIAPGVAPRLGLPRTLALGGSGYFFLMVALLLHSTQALPEPLLTILMLLASFVNGLGGALLWSAQGSLVILEAARANDNGKQAGDFWALFHCSTIAGNAWAYLSFSSGGSPTGLFAAFAVVALCGCCLFGRLRPSPAREEDTVIDPRVALAASDAARLQPPQQQPPPPPPGHASTAPGASAVVSEARAMWALVLSSMDLLPLLLLGGALMSYQFGVFPLILRPSDVGAVFIVFGLAEVSGALVAGRLVDVLSTVMYRVLTLCLTVLSLLLAAPLALEYDARRAAASNATASEHALDGHPDESSRLLLPAIAAVAFGGSDSAIAVLAYARLGRRFSDERGSARAGAARQVFYSLGFLAGFAVGPYVAGAVQLAILSALLLVAWRVLVRADALPLAQARPSRLGPSLQHQPDPKAGVSEDATV